MNKPSLLSRNLLYDGRKAKLESAANFVRDYAQDHADGSALLEDVCAKSSKAGHAVSYVNLAHLFEALLLPVGHHGEGHVQSVFGRHASSVNNGPEFSAYAYEGQRSGLNVQVRGAVARGGFQ